MTENYSEYIARELLAQWISDPSKALGRRGSSPWPDRIEWKTIKRINRDQFVVTGEICEITSVPQEEWRKRATFIVTKRETKWLITGITQ
ncbi:MAG: hypothetical protein HPY68_05340 [Candidatus Atribacteria bacterium]|nr:hypothetical protein [Candidatus Atribacteria bacterium]